jgi:hypothetical protein
MSYCSSIDRHIVKVSALFLAGLLAVLKLVRLTVTWNFGFTQESATFKLQRNFLIGCVQKTLEDRTYEL